MNLGVALRTFKELFWLPALGAMLPWSAGYSVLSRLARSERLYAEPVRAAAEGAALVGPSAADPQWTWRHRLLRLVDHCDMLLVRTRTRRWFARHVDVDGSWPAGGAFLAMTFHWGAGMWAFVDLHRGGRVARMLVARHSRADFGANWIAWLYARMRNRTVERAGGGAVILTGGATRAIHAALAAGEAVVALYDVPAGLTGTTVRTQVCGRSALLPAGLARVAVESGVPVVPFSMGLDFATGRRKLTIEAPFEPASVQQFADRLGQSLTRLIEHDSAQWHFSAHAREFFARDEPAARGGAINPG